jgi:hypothetical protein
MQGLQATYENCNAAGKNFSRRRCYKCVRVVYIDVYTEWSARGEGEPIDPVSPARFISTTFLLNSIRVFSSAMQTSEASVVAIGFHVSVLARQVHLRNDVADDALVFQNALISE